MIYGNYFLENYNKRISYHDSNLFNESFHKSELDDNFKKKSNKDINYEVLDIHSSKAKKYIDNDSYLSKQNLKSYNGEIIVDKDNNTIIGRFLIGTGKDEGYIGALRVNDKYKGYGFGSILVKDSINKYHGRDLNVMKDNKVAIELYKKNGFKIIDHPINSSKDSYYMKLNKNR